MKLRFSYYNLRRFKRAFILALMVMFGIFTCSVIDNRGIDHFWYTLAVSFILGIPLGIFEEFVFANRFKKKPFLVILLVKGLVYWLTASILFMVLIYIVGLILNLPFERYIEFLSSGEFLRGLIYTIFVYDMVIVFNQYDRLLGHELTFLYAYGKYQTPEREDRIFMFLDLDSSTELAEKMERERYFNFVNDFFHDISEPVLRCSAQIYQYVGDEVVFTWRIKDGLREGNCVKLYFQIKEAIEKKSYLYKSRYNNIPKFKAGLHCGEVIAAVVGDIKKELIYNGDVLNTAARIRSACADLGESFLISSELLNKLKMPKEIQKTDKGKIELKGKAVPLHLYSLAKS